MSTSQHPVYIESQVCPSCGIHYGLDKEYIADRRRLGGNWFCPNGHNVIFTTAEKANGRRLETEDSLVQKLRGQVDTLQAENRKLDFQATAATYQAELQREKNAKLIEQNRALKRRG